MLPATEHAPVHIADVITAIGKLRKTKLETGAIAAALGYAELRSSGWRPCRPSIPAS